MSISNYINSVSDITTIHPTVEKYAEKKFMALIDREEVKVELKDVNGEDYLPGTLSEYSKEQIDRGIADANRFLVGKNTKFTYKIHEGTGRTLVALVDIQSEEIIKEIPPEKFLDTVAQIWEAAGLLVNKKG